MRDEDGIKIGYGIWRTQENLYALPEIPFKLGGGETLILPEIKAWGDDVNPIRLIDVCWEAHLEGDSDIKLPVSLIYKSLTVDGNPTYSRMKVGFYNNSEKAAMLNVYAVTEEYLGKVFVELIES